MSNLDEQGRLARNEYIRAWRRAHPDRVKEANRKYWAKRAKRQAEELKEGARHEETGR